MAGKMLYKDAGGAGGASGPPSNGSKPWENPEGDIPPTPSSPPPPGYEYRLQTGPDGRKFWGVVAAAAISAVGSYLSARSANKPRQGYTDQTTTQSPYLAGMIQPDLEAILSYQRALINQGPSYVGPQSTWPHFVSPQLGRAPGPVSTTFVDYANWHDPNGPQWGPARSGSAREAGSSGGYTYGDIGGDPNPEAYVKISSDESRSGRGDLAYLRALFASTGRGRG